ncbi:hypothetical protein RB594_003444 [Gaeumannomyces avenae]
MKTASIVAALSGCITIATAKSISMTPHQQYSSSVGVLGCKIDTNRAAFWPIPVDCNNICVKVTHKGRHVTLLRIDESRGAYDISYDAWNYLTTGFSAKDAGKASQGGAVAAEYEDVHGSDPECRKLMHTAGNKLALSASNSQNFITSCAPGTFVRDNMIQLNIKDAQCQWGKDEVCKLTDADRAAGLNQPACPSGLGNQDKMKPCLVKDIKYGTGKHVCADGSDAAGTPQVPAPAAAAPPPTMR